MPSFETTATVQSNGQLQVSGVPFPQGTAVEVLITPQRSAAVDFVTRWREVTSQLRVGRTELTDQEIHGEIENYRARR